MKQKIYIAILIITICFFPIKIFGYFANPDEHINSMSFGAKDSNTNIQKLTTPPNLIKINDENIGNNVLDTVINDNTIINNSNLSSPKSVVLNYISSNYYFFWSIVFSIIIVLMIILFLFARRVKKEV